MPSVARIASTSRRRAAFVTRSGASASSSQQTPGAAEAFYRDVSDPASSEHIKVLGPPPFGTGAAD